MNYVNLLFMDEHSGERLKKLLDSEGIRYSDFAAKLSIVPQSLNNWFKRGVPGKEIFKVAAAADVRPEWLSNGKGQMRLTNIATDHQFSRDPNKPIPVQLKRVPVVGTAQLGTNGYWEELQYPVGYGDGFVDASVGDPNAYALRVVGDSMSPRIKDGEFVVITPNREPIPGDEVLVKTKDDQCMIKELLHIRDGIASLGSVNEAHGRRNIPLDQIEKMHCVHSIVPKGSFVPS